MWYIIIIAKPRPKKSIMTNPLVPKSPKNIRKKLMNQYDSYRNSENLNFQNLESRCSGKKYNSRFFSVRSNGHKRPRCIKPTDKIFWAWKVEVQSFDQRSPIFGYRIFYRSFLEIGEFPEIELIYDRKNLFLVLGYKKHQWMRSADQNYHLTTRVSNGNFYTVNCNQGTGWS